MVEIKRFSKYVREHLEVPSWNYMKSLSPRQRSKPVIDLSYQNDTLYIDASHFKGRRVDEPVKNMIFNVIKKSQVFYTKIYRGKQTDETGWIMRVGSSLEVIPWSSKNYNWDGTE